MKIENVYIAGCGGMLGEAVYSHFSGKYTVKATDIELSEDWVEEGDIRDYEAVRSQIVDFKPQAVVNLAALTDMEHCEKNVRDAYITNALGAENLALISAELDIPYVYVSTAGVFDGEKQGYTEYDLPNPLSIYAKSKYEGEQSTRIHAPKHFIVRAGWMMGGGPNKDKKFINKIYKQIKQGADTLNIVGDKYGSPTYTWDFAKGLDGLLATRLYGTYHQSCSGDCSRYDTALEFLNCLGLQNEITVNKVNSDFFKTDYFAPRPESEILTGEKMSHRGLMVMKDWKTSLKEYSKLYLKDLNG